MPMIDCRHFSGSKPCGLSNKCDEDCPQLDRPAKRLLFIHLGAMGAVVRSTSLLAAIKRKFPSSHLTWVTQAPMQHLLKDHPLIDRVLTTSSADQLVLQALEFDVAFVLDKSLEASGLLQITKSQMVFGFRADRKTGSILPANRGAVELWELGLNDQKKFFENQKPETQIWVEALELGPYLRDEYDLKLSEQERNLALQRHQAWSLRTDQPVIGLNTGCGPLMPAKKWTVDFHRQVIRDLQASGWSNFVLLGGPEDRQRNLEIGEGLPVLQSPCDQGLRDGWTSVHACDVVVTGDSLGMHLAIAAQKFVVAWFGPSCSQEIDLFERGVKLQAQVGCSPCWKKNCEKTTMCYDRVELKHIREAVQTGMIWWQKQKHSLQQSELLENRITTESPSWLSKPLF